MHRILAILIHHLTGPIPGQLKIHTFTIGYITTLRSPHRPIQKKIIKALNSRLLNIIFDSSNIASSSTARLLIHSSVAGIQLEKPDLPGQWTALMRQRRAEGRFGCWSVAALVNFFHR